MKTLNIDAARKSVIWNEPYEALGVKPFINCCGTRTVHGGSLMLPEVKAAMAAASTKFVNLNELMSKARIRISELTGAEDGIVTAGSAAAIAIATAGAMAGNDPIKMLRLPHIGEIVNQVVMLKSHRFPYDQAIRMVGAKITEVDNLQQLNSLDFDLVAMIFYLGSRDFNAEIPFDEFVAISRKYKVPLLVDAASEHIERPNKWLERGADLVVYSGGKVLRGPQTSGLLLGRTELIEAAWANSPPHRAFGRPMKIGKEDIIGILAALEIWFSRESSELMNIWLDDTKTINQLVNTLPGITCETIPPDEGDKTPKVLIKWNNNDVPLHGLELRRLLLEGEPRILLDDVSAKRDSITLEVISLQPGEAKIVGESISRCLKGVKDPIKPCHNSANISGEWKFEVNFIRWPRVHHVQLTQENCNVFGRHHSPKFEGSISGTIQGKEVNLFFEDTYEGAIITYNFIGLVSGDNMEGNVFLGSTTPETRGEVSYSQYGKVLWVAKRT